MNRLAVVISLISHFFTTFAQPASTRCELSIKGDPQFESWLQRKRSTQARIATEVYRIPVVVHVLHTGEPLGEGFNFSDERIRGQIRTLNEDFRRKLGTPGFNAHPDGDDPHIEFVLAEFDPDGRHTNGIVRIDQNKVQLPPQPAGDIISVASLFSYWDPVRYLNIWCMDAGFPPGTLVGSARFPISDLKGLENITEPDADGIYITALNFGQGNTNTFPPYDKGRTLTHEMGHFLGLLHTFGSLDFGSQCDGYTDHCSDTPPLSRFTSGCPSTSPVACDGSPAMFENYMDYTDDGCVNIFTKEQVARMRTVLENSPRRKSLVTSPAIRRNDEVTGLPDDPSNFRFYPNPAREKIYLSIGDDLNELTIRVTAFSLTGKVLFSKMVDRTGAEVEIPVTGIHEPTVLLRVEASTRSHQELIVLH